MTNKTYWNWLHEQELIAARAKAPADRTEWEAMIVASDNKRKIAEGRARYAAWFFNATIITPR